MRSKIATVVAFSSILIGTVAVVQAHEMPETFLTVGDRLQDGRVVRSRNYFNQNVSGLYINRVPNCTLLGHQIYPCE